MSCRIISFEFIMFYLDCELSNFNIIKEEEDESIDVKGEVSEKKMIQRNKKEVLSKKKF